jgi:hypothetical protein
VYGLLHLLVWIENDVARGVVHETDRESTLQLAPTGLTHHPADEACPKKVQLCFAHRPLQAEKEAVVEVGGIVDAILVED